MPPPRRGASTVSGYQRQRPLTNLAILPETTVSSSTSAFSRQTYHNVNYPARSPSPPASAYFPMLSSTSEPRPTPNAQAHFAYSTTLRRHPDYSLASPAVIAQAVNAEASSLWQRAIATITGQPLPEEAAENGHADPGRLKEEIRDTASARFAHYTVEDTVAYFRTFADTGLMAADIPALQDRHGYNEFTVSTPEPLLLKFAKTIYESPLILLVWERLR